MITQTKTYNLPGTTGSSTVTYTMSSSNPCASVSPSSGTVSPGNSVEFTFTFEDETCFSDAVFTLSKYDDICSTPVSTVFSLTNPCNSLSSTISNTPSTDNPFVFTASTTGGVAPYRYKWSWNTATFKQLEFNGAQMILSPLYLSDPNISPPSTSKIKLLTIDANGCEYAATYTYNFCSPIASNEIATTSCIPSTVFNGITFTSAVTVDLSVSTCSGTTTDWSKFSSTYDSSKLRVVNDEGVLTIYATQQTTTTNYTIRWSVQNSVGVASNIATVTVSVPVCTTTKKANPVIESKTTKLAPADTAGTVKELDVSAITFAQDN